VHLGTFAGLAVAAMLAGLAAQSVRGTLSVSHRCRPCWRCRFRRDVLRDPRAALGLRIPLT
jgi:hypothetical protein